METARPVDADIGSVRNQFPSSFDGCARVALAEIVNAGKYGTVVTHIEFRKHAFKLLGIVWRHSVLSVSSLLALYPLFALPF